MNRIACGILGMVIMPMTVRSASAAVTLWSQNFDQIAVGSTYADSTTLSSTTGTTDDVTLRTSGTANSNFTLVDRGSGNHALQFTDNDSSQSTFPKANSFNFRNTTPTSTGSTGNNYVSGSFTYTRLLSQTTPATSPSFAFTATASVSDFVLYLTVENDGHVHYYNGATNVDSGVTLQTGTEYTFVINADLSNSSQDKWSLQVTPIGSQTAVLNLANINTKVANDAIVQFSLWGGLNTGGLNSSPFAQIDNINFSAAPVPEPASLGMLLLAGGALRWRRRRA